MCNRGTVIGEKAESVSAYAQAETHNNMNKSSNPEEKLMDSCSYTTTRKNKQVHVTLEFPKQTDQKAEQEFISRLKELYLEKIKKGSCINGDSALLSDKIKEVEEMEDGEKS